MLTPDNNTSQADSQEMTPEEAKASMGIATMLQQQLMPQAPMEGQETQESAPGQEQAPETDNQPEEPEEANNEELEEIKDEISALREEIKQALTEDENEKDGE